MQAITTCIFLRKRPLVIRGDADRENIFYSTFFCLSKTMGLNYLVKNCQKPAIVFCNSRKTTFDLCMQIVLLNRNIPCRYYHAGLSKAERESLEQWFLKSKDGVLFATSAYGLGIDKSNLRTVIHYNLPSDTEEYLQESGRAGRDGKQAKAYVLITPNEEETELSKVFTSQSCRRSALLKAIGQEKDECTGCDVCNSTVMKKPFGYEVIKSVARRYPFRYTQDSLVQILCSAKREDSLNPYCNVFSEYDPDSVQEAVRTVSEELLLKKPGKKSFFKILPGLKQKFNLSKNEK